MAVVTSKGQITLPKKVRDALGLATGSRVEFDIHDGQAVLRRVIPEEHFAKWQGFLKDLLPEGEDVDTLLGEDRGS